MKNERKDIMAEERVEPKPIDLGEYKFGFHDDVEPVLSTGKGLNEDVIRELSAAKGEPEWMLEFRLKSYETFKKMPMQTWGADLSEIDFDDLIYYQKPSDKPARSWDEVPEKIKETFERIGIPEAERAYLAGKDISSRPSPTTTSPITAPLRKAMRKPAFNELRAAFAVRAEAYVAVFIPRNPERPEKNPPVRKAIGTQEFCTPKP